MRQTYFDSKICIKKPPKSGLYAKQLLLDYGRKGAPQM